MPKSYIKSLHLIPESKNFSEYDKLAENGTFEVGDDGMGEETMYSVMQTDMFMYNLLLNFSERQKITFLYLMMRESGYNLTHEECARTLSMKRESYMNIVRVVKKKAQKILKQQSRY